MYIWNHFTALSCFNRSTDPSLSFPPLFVENTKSLKISTREVKKKKKRLLLLFSLNWPSTILLRGPYETNSLNISPPSITEGAPTITTKEKAFTSVAKIASRPPCQNFILTLAIAREAELRRPRSECQAVGLGLVVPCPTRPAVPRF